VHTALSEGRQHADYSRVRTAVIGAMAVVVCLAVAVPPGDAAAPLSSHVRVGAWAKGMVDDPSVLTSLEQQVGRRFDIASYFYGYGDWFPADIEKTFAAGGTRDVLISWDMGDTRFAEWSQGQHDEYLRTIGRLARDYPYPVYVRPWPEMNGDWQTFMPTASGDRPNGGTPEQFKAAWRHVVDTVRSEGGTNVKWVFNPYAATYEGSADVRTLWPGRAYVDVLGIDGYNWGGGPAPWQSFATIFGPMYSILTSLDPDLPVWICEVASREPSVNDGAPIIPGASKADWINEAFASTAFPRVTALVWFHEQKERDWRIDSSAAALQAFRAQVTGLGASPAPSTRPKKKPRRALSVVRATSQRIRIAVRPAAATRLLVERLGQRGWRKTSRAKTDQRGRAWVKRSPGRLRISAPQLGRTVLLASR
jgi:hypothetical protein